MSRVNLLPPQIVSKIAAGEVIERPASVVKELLENSIDAESDKIEINVKQGGSTLIQIKDNGRGIHKDDLEKVFERHATSKISQVDDLFKIASLGFRGEALYTVAAVSDIFLRSRTADDDSGWEIHMRGGEKKAFKPVAMPQGTEVEVKELFFNTPARRKFMKTPATEFKQILNAVLPHALKHEKCAISLSHISGRTEKKVLDLKPETELANRIAAALNIDPVHIVECSREIKHRKAKLRAFLGDSNIRRTSKDMQYLFINGRPVSSRLLSYQMNDMYRALFPSDIYPFFVIYLDVPAEDVDANIHPTKKEVKIRNEYDLFLIIRSMCEEILMNMTKAKQVESSPFKFPASKETSEQSAKHNKPAFALNKSTINAKVSSQQKTLNLSNSFDYKTSTSDGKRAQHKADYISKATENLLTDIEVSEKLHNSFSYQPLKEKLKEAAYSGSFRKKYLFYEAGSSLLLVDQHAAQERINFEALKRQIENEQIEIQNLLAPYLIKLSPSELLSWEENEDALSTLGFSTSKWDDNTIAIHSHPQLLKQPDVSVQNLLAGNEISRCDTETIARRACRKSIMSGDPIDANGAENIRTNLLKCSDPFTCPHGRPTVVELQESFLDRQFLRT